MLPHLSICLCLCRCFAGFVHFLNVFLHYATLSAKKVALEKAAAEAKAAEEAAGVVSHFTIFFVCVIDCCEGFVHILNIFYAASLYQPRKLPLKRLKPRRRKRQRVCCFISRSSLFVSL